MADTPLYNDAVPPGSATVDVDPFSLEFFADPYPSHAALRDAGRVVWLTKYNISATARYAEVRQALLEYKTFSSARGVGLADFWSPDRLRRGSESRTRPVKRSICTCSSTG